METGSEDAIAGGAARLDELQGELESEAADMDADAAQQVQTVAAALGQLADATRSADPDLVANAAQAVRGAVTDLCSA